MFNLNNTRYATFHSYSVNMENKDIRNVNSWTKVSYISDRILEEGEYQKNNLEFNEFVLSCEILDVISIVKRIKDLLSFDNSNTFFVRRNSNSYSEYVKYHDGHLREYSLMLENEKGSFSFIFDYRGVIINYDSKGKKVNNLEDVSETNYLFNECFRKLFELQNLEKKMNEKVKKKSIL